MLATFGGTMTYNEWRDELKSNLLSVSDAERRRVLDYYAEAYADRREAGFTEREIIEDFGAPYDAAQRILYEGDDEYEPRRAPRYDEPRMERHAERREEHREERAEYRDERREEHGRCDYDEPRSARGATAKKRDDYTWVFVLLCIIFAVPLFGLVMAMVGVTIGLCVAPFSIFASGIAQVFAGIGLAMTNITAGFGQIGIGLILTGVGLVLIPVAIWFVKLMWKLFKKFFAWVKSLFKGKEGA